MIRIKQLHVKLDDFVPNAGKHKPINLLSIYDLKADFYNKARYANRVYLIIDELVFVLKNRYQ